MSKVVKTVKNVPVCGIIMPISDIDSYPKGHWTEVYDILFRSIQQAGFKPQLVSSGDKSEIILYRIVENLSENPFVVCDISGSNPNVLFELGLRTAFDKLFVIVKDDRTPFNFNTSVIDHLTYPSDLRHGPINNFIKGLTAKIKSVFEAYTSDQQYPTFMKRFSKQKSARNANEIRLGTDKDAENDNSFDLRFYVQLKVRDKINSIIKSIQEQKGVVSVEETQGETGRRYLLIKIEPNADRDGLIDTIDDLLND